MIFLLCAGFGLLLGLLWGWLDGYDGPLYGGFIGLFFGGLIAGILWIAAIFLLPSHDVPNRYDLVSLQDATGIQGGFFLGSGYIDNSLSDTWYQRESDGSYTGHTKDADYVKVFQDGPKTPYLIKYQAQFNWSWARWLFPMPSASNTPRAYQFHIPKDSIKSGFTLGARN